jgi:hypothetical protein
MTKLDARLARLIGLVLASLMIVAFTVSYARAEKYVVERYTTGTAKIIELYNDGESYLPVYQQGRPQAVCDGFRVLTGTDAHRCVTVRRDDAFPQLPRRQ